MRPLSLNSNDELAEVLLLLSTYKEHQSHTRQPDLAEGEGKTGKGILVVGPGPFPCPTFSTFYSSASSKISGCSCQWNPSQKSPA